MPHSDRPQDAEILLAALRVLNLLNWLQDATGTAVPGMPECQRRELHMACDRAWQAVSSALTCHTPGRP